MTTSLPTLAVGNSAAPNDWNSAPNGALTLVGAGGQDTSNAHQSTNTTGTYDQGYSLADVPSDFNTMASLAIQLRYGRSANNSLTVWNSLSVRIVSGATILAASTAGGAFQVIAETITTTTPTNSGVISFDYVNTGASKAQWDAAVVEIRIVRTRDKGGSNDELRVFALSATGEYQKIQTEVLLANSISTGFPTIETPTLTPFWSLSADSINTGLPTTGSPNVTIIIQSWVQDDWIQSDWFQIAEIGDLFTDGLTTSAPTVGNAQLSQTHKFVGISVFASAPTYVAPSFGQVHGFVANDVTTGAPAVGQPSASGGISLSAVGVNAGQPDIGSPTFRETNRLQVSELATGAPELQLPILASPQFLVAGSITTASPTVGLAVFAQTHRFVAASLYTAPPDIGQPFSPQLLPGDLDVVRLQGRQSIVVLRGAENKVHLQGRQSVVILHGVENRVELIGRQSVRRLG